jgi:sugar phosphate isomerase/epimerase
MSRPAQRLTYCTNVHPLQNEAVWREKIGFFGPKMAEITGIKPFPMGLWFNDAVLKGVEDDPRGVRAALEGWDATVFTLNAFPFMDFHQPVVKRAVYLPDWTDPARLDYTKRCAALLATLLPEGEDFGSISTLPLGWRVDWTEQHSTKAAEALSALALYLADLKERTGKHIALAIEPEPGCVLERTSQVISFWNDVLRPVASCDAMLAVEEHIGLCYDTCHQAVQFEDAEEALAALAKAEIRIHKMQLSSAPEFPADLTQSTRDLRERFVEPKFLHQTRVKTDEGVWDLDDLPQALNAGPGLFAYDWRVHYHVPVHAETLFDGAVRTTRGEMLKALRYALTHNLCRHFEVETYTWSVLPEEHRPVGDEGLAEAIAREIEFIRGEFPNRFMP